MPSRKADPFHWDGLVRLTHWGVAAICIGNLWLNEAGEEWHERMGYAVMVLIGLRLLWGLTFARGLVLATAGTGWFQNTETGFELGADDWHEWCTWALQGMIALHLSAIVYTSWRQRSNLVTRMLPRRRRDARVQQQEPNT